MEPGIAADLPCRRTNQEGGHVDVEFSGHRAQPSVVPLLFQQAYRRRVAFERSGGESINLPGDVYIYIA